MYVPCSKTNYKFTRREKMRRPETDNQKVKSINPADEERVPLRSEEKGLVDFTF